MATIIKNFHPTNRMDSNFNQDYRRWAIVQSLINVIGLLITLQFGNSQIWFACAGIWFIVYIVNIPKYCNLPAYLGYASWVTVIRLSIIFILGFTYQQLEGFMLFIGFLIAIVLDGVDGFLARKFDQSSRVGEGIDMESDAFMVLLISWMHFDSGSLPWWILIPGGLRYYYELGFFWLRDQGADVPSKRIRATVAVIFFVALLTPFILSSKLSLIIVCIASTLIVLSFIASITKRLKK